MLKGSLRLNKNASAVDIRNKRNLKRNKSSLLNELYCDNDNNFKLMSHSIGSSNGDIKTIESLSKELFEKNKYIKQLETQLKEMKMQIKVIKDKLHLKSKQFDEYIEEHNTNVNDTKHKIENIKLHKQLHQIQKESKSYINENNKTLNDYITHIEELKRINTIICKHNKELENENNAYVSKIKQIEEQNKKQSNIIQQMNKDCVLLQTKNEELITNDKHMKSNIINICNMIKALYSKERTRFQNEEMFIEKIEQYFTNEYLQTESNNNYDNIVIHNISSK